MLHGSLSLNGKDKIEVSFTPNTSRPERPDAVDRITSSSALFGQNLQVYDPETKQYVTTNQETIVHEDWLCEFVNHLLFYK
jgi:hypothetical protein